MSTDSSAADCSVALGDGVSDPTAAALVPVAVLKFATAVAVAMLEYEWLRPMTDVPHAPDADMVSEGGSMAPPFLPAFGAWLCERAALPPSTPDPVPAVKLYAVGDKARVGACCCAPGGPLYPLAPAAVCSLHRGGCSGCRWSK